MKKLKVSIFLLADSLLSKGKMAALIIATILPVTASSADITGLGDIKIGSTKAQVKQLMKEKKSSVLPTGADFGTYDGGSFDAFEKVFITQRIKLEKIFLYYHNDYLHLISAQDEYDDADLKELVAGFKHKYGEPTREEIQTRITNPCNESQIVEEHTKKEIFNSGSKIEAAFTETIYTIPNTKTPVSVCEHYIDVGFSVYDAEVLKAATEKQKAQNEFDEQNDMNDRFEGL